MKTTAHLAVAAFLALATVHAEPPERPQAAEAKRLIEQAREARKAGRHDEAREPHEKVAKLMGEAKQRGHDQHGGREAMLKQARGRIEQLREEGKTEEAAHLEQRLAHAMKHHSESDHKGPAEGPARLRHAMAAAQHLREAGLGEVAKNVEQIAGRMKEELAHRPHPEKKAPAAPAEPEKKRQKQPLPPGGGEIQALREQVMKLTHAVEELKKRVEEAPGREQIKKPEPKERF